MTDSKRYFAAPSLFFKRVITDRMAIGFIGALWKNKVLSIFSIVALHYIDDCGKSGSYLDKV